MSKKSRKNPEISHTALAQWVVDERRLAAAEGGEREREWIDYDRKRREYAIGMGLPPIEPAWDWDSRLGPGQEKLTVSSAGPEDGWVQERQEWIDPDD